MFFRRKPQVETTFEQRLDALRQAGFEIAAQTDGQVLVRKHGCGALIAGGNPPTLERAGWMVGGQVSRLVDGGYQKFWVNGGQRQAPALASQLKALHEFEEDLRAALGVESLYNTSLGTINDLHTYDGVDDLPIYQQNPQSTSEIT